jgi:hypothetical protein
MRAHTRSVLIGPPEHPSNSQAILTIHFNFSVASLCPALLPHADRIRLQGFRNRLDRRKGLKLTISKPGLKVEITAAGNPKQIKHFRESAEKMLRRCRKRNSPGPQGRGFAIISPKPWPTLKVRHGFIEFSHGVINACP